MGQPAIRHDLYRHIHKGLRVALFDSVRKVGLADPQEDAELLPALECAERLLALLAAHIKHEDDFVHAAIEARRPGGALETTRDHREHTETLQGLRAEIDALRQTAPAEREPLVHRLYHRLALLTAENLEHMNVEESCNNELLWSLYRDDELEALHDRLVATVEPQIMDQALDWMAEGLNPQELIALLGEMQRKAPPEAFVAALERMRQRLPGPRWSRLANALCFDTLWLA